ncbi:MAG: hypothetical protein Q9197_005932, partial [Variospora fuerteventurae]
MASQAGTTMEKIGVFPPPPGVLPNFENPEYRSAGIVPLAAILIPLTAIFMTLRVYTKLRIIKIFGLEDWTILAAYLCTIFVSIATLVQQNNGNGVHIWDITRDQWSVTLQWGAASVVIYVPAVGLAKVAILLFYLRLNPDRHFRMTVYITLALTVSYVVVLSLTILLQCSPVPAFWDPSITGRKCVQGTKLYLANAILNVIFDFMVLLVPVPMLLKLQVPTRQKLVIGALFSLGSITCVVSAVRIHLSESLIPLAADLTWHLPKSTSFIFVECHLSVICGCVMVFRPLLRRHFPYLLGNAYHRCRSPGGDGGPLGGGAFNNSHGKGGGGGMRSCPAGVPAKKHCSHSDDSAFDVDMDDTAVEDDVELARWDSRHYTHPHSRSESQEHIIVPAAEVRLYG